MADLSSVTDNYLPTASETFADNLSGSISAGATTVPVNSAVEYPDGATVVLTVDPGTALEATFVGKKDTGADQFIECIWTEGNTAVGHDAGATIIDYDSATHYNLLSEAMQLIMNQDGTLKDDPIRTALGLSDAADDGWEVFPYTFSVSSGYNAGHYFDLTVANQDVRTSLSAGMKLRLERGTAPGTQCMDLEAGSSQYASDASVSGMSFTDDYTLEAWIKPESWALGVIVARDGGAAGRFQMYFSAIGQIIIDGQNAAAQVDSGTSYPSVELNKWTHIAATMDMSATTSTMYFNGISVGVSYTNGAGAAMTNAGTLYIGRNAGGNYFDGKVSDVRVWSAVRTATQIRDNMWQQLVGNETNLVGYWKLNGDLNDSTSNANHLTGSGGAVATNTDNPFHTTEYAEIMEVTYSSPNSTVRVRTPENYGIPNMTLSAPFYTTQYAPYGFPPISNLLGLALQNYTFTATAIAAAPALSVPVYVNEGQRVRITVKPGIGLSLDQSGSQFRVSIWDGVVNSGPQLDESFGTTAAANQGGSTPIIYTGILTPGAHTINVGLRSVGAGTTSMAGAPTTPCTLTVEIMRS